jgi:hypothetical protein
MFPIQIHSQKTCIIKPHYCPTLQCSLSHVAKREGKGGVKRREEEGRKIGKEELGVTCP